MTGRECGEYRDEARCAACGGRCCRIYYPAGCAGTPVAAAWWYGDFSDFFHGERESYGIEPLFRPDAIAGSASPLEAREALRRAGVDPDACEYLGPAGCRIEWERRPAQCRAHRCRQWESEDAITAG